MNVTFKQLKAFVVLANELNFSKAASRLHITGPTLTATIKGLESALQVKLFDRSTRSVKLTAHSLHFLSIADRLLDDLDRAVRDMKEQANLHAGSVVVSGATSFLFYVMTPAIRTLSVQHPGIKVRLIEAATESVISDVTTGEADFGITTLLTMDPELEASNLVSDRIGVICNRNHPFAIRAQPIPTHELDGNTFIALSKQNGLRAVIDREKRLPEICKRPQYEASVVHLIKPMIKDGIGIALLPAMASRSITDKDVVYVPLKAAVWRHVHFVTHKGRSLSPAAAHLKKLVLEQLSRFKGDSMVRVSESDK